MSEAKPYVIPKQLVWEAYQRVKANQGAAGVDGESLAMFEQDLKGNLYKVWNRMSSGSYFPPPVRLVEIPKDDGGTRPLGIPTVADRVAQTVVKMVLEPLVEPQFHPDSYGYRPGKSALDAVGTARRRCWPPTGSSIWTSKRSLIPSRMTWSSGPSRTTPTIRGSGCTSLGGFVPRCSGRTAHGSSGRRARRKAVSSVRCWPISSCITRSKLDAADVSGRPVRTLRGRCHRPLQERAAGQGGVGRDSRSVRAVRSGASSDEDADCLLQGRQPARGARTRRRSTFWVSPSNLDARKNRWGKNFCGFLPAMSTKAANALRRTIREWRLASTKNHYRLGGLASTRGPGGAGVDELLRPVLPDEVCADAPASQRGPGCVGATEVQAVSLSAAGVAAVAAAHRATGPQAFRSVAAGRETVRLKGKSRMRRESHVRFCEGGGVRFPSATRPAAAQTPAPAQPAAPAGQQGRQGGPAQPGQGRGGARGGGAAGIQMTPGRGPAGPGYTEPLGKKHVTRARRPGRFLPHVHAEGRRHDSRAR